MGWTACNASPITDLTVTANQASGINLVVMVSGQTDPTTAYQCQILYGNASKTVPDAWRFDAAGCQGSAFVVVNAKSPAALSKTCPSFQDAGAPNQALAITDVSFYPSGHSYASTLMRISCANSYPAGNVPVGATKYFLCDAEFNESFGVVGASDPGNTCGGLEGVMCFNLASASFLPNDGVGTEADFVFHGGATGDWATASTAGPAGGCQGTPAQTRTWGSIKSQYRN
jgi:hypothetical protein